MTDPLAYFLTWTSYGTWLHGDGRGWIDRNHNRVGEPIPGANVVRQNSASTALKHAPMRFSQLQRERIASTIAEVFDFKHWYVHALNCRSNHVHVVVTALGETPERVMNTLKSWCSRDLNAEFGRKE